MTEKPLLILGAAALMLAACQQEREDEGDYRDAHEQIEDVVASANEADAAIDDCQNAFRDCIDGGDVEACAAELEECILELPEISELPDPGDLPDIPGLPDFPDLPELPDGPAGDCGNDLFDCLAGGGDPATCAGEAEGCIGEAVELHCAEAIETCHQAGAPAGICDSIPC